MQTEAQQAAMQDRVLVLKDRINALAEEITGLSSPELTDAENLALHNAYHRLDQADNELGVAFT